MSFDPGPVIGYSWDAVGVVWLFLYGFTKQTVRRQPGGPRVFYLLMAVLGGFLMSSHLFRYGWMALRFVPHTPVIQLTGAAFTVAGCAFAIWARLQLGANWSGSATVKANHELVVTGPYALARHPIYTGLSLAIVGTALFVGECRALLAIVLLFLFLAVKMSQEERLMMETFPAEYPAYRERVKTLIPWIW
jgi:protein-S-isoprenylcysteine O-methyltransferase